MSRAGCDRPEARDEQLPVRIVLDESSGRPADRRTGRDQIEADDALAAALADLPPRFLQRHVQRESVSKSRAAHASASADASVASASRYSVRMSCC
jgi:hypothetical protein